MDPGRTLLGAPSPAPATPSLLVVAAPAEPPPACCGAGTVPKIGPVDASSPVWPPAAQWSAAAFLSLALALLAWHGYAAHRWSARPTALEPGGVESERLDLNRADYAQLVQLPGVGPSLARRIEEYRRQHGRFPSVEDLRQVRGIGPAVLERLRPFVAVEPYSGTEPTPPAPPPPRVARAAAPDEPARRPAGSGKKPPLTGPVPVNSASAEELRRLPGIGPTLAQRIIETRAARPFRSVEELRRVRGIGAKTLERLRPHVTVEEKGR